MTNLDAEGPDFLIGYATTMRNPNAPDDDPRNLLARYALVTAHAKQHRLAGRISIALELEAWADQVYARLPEGCKW